MEASQNIPSDQNGKDNSKPKRKMTPEALEKLQQARQLALEKKRQIKEAKDTIREQERQQLNEKAKQIVNEAKVSKNLSPVQEEQPSSVVLAGQSPPTNSKLYANYEQHERNERSNVYIDPAKGSSLQDQSNQSDPPPSDYTDHAKGSCLQDQYAKLYSKLQKIDEIDNINNKLQKLDEISMKFDIMMEEKKKRTQAKEQSRKDFYNQIPINIQKKMMDEELQQKEIERFRNKWFGTHNILRR